MKSIKIVIIIFIFVNFVCHKNDFRLKIINRTNTNFYVISYDTSNLADYPNRVLNLAKDFVKIHDTIEVMTNRNGWPNHIRNSRNKKLNLFLIHEDTVKSRTRNCIVENKMYLKFLSFDLNQLEKMNWQIVIDSI